MNGMMDATHTSIIVCTHHETNKHTHTHTHTDTDLVWSALLAAADTLCS